MKVLHVESGKHLYGGALQVRYLMEGLSALSVQNILACPVGSAISVAAAPFAQIEAIAMKGDADIGLTNRICKLIQKHRPDVVHLHSRRGADSWGALAAKWAGVPCILSRRVDNPESRLGLALKYPLYSHVITISEGIRRVLLEQGVPSDKVTCVRSALDPTPYLQDAVLPHAALRQAYQLAPDAVVAAMVAQLIPRKGHRYVLAVLPTLLAQYPNLQVLFFGQGPLEPELRATLAQAPYLGRVRLAGFRDDLPTILGGVDILLHPADREGLGIALLQAAAAAVPIIASRAGGIPEAVEDGKTGILIEPGDTAALALAFNDLLQYPAKRREMGEAGRARVLSEFSVSAMTAGNFAVYQKVLNQTT